MAGSGSATAIVRTVERKGRPSTAQITDVELPFATSVPIGDAALSGYDLVAVDGAADDAISCRIADTDGVLDRASASGPQTTASCHRIPVG